MTQKAIKFRAKIAYSDVFASLAQYDVIKYFSPQTPCRLQVSLQNEITLFVFVDFAPFEMFFMSFAVLRSYRTGSGPFLQVHSPGRGRRYADRFYVRVFERFKRLREFNRFFLFCFFFSFPNDHWSRTTGFGCPALKKAHRCHIEFVRKMQQKSECFTIRCYHHSLYLSLSL